MRQKTAGHQVLANFKAELQSRLITEWLRAYINYQTASVYLSVLVDVYHRYHYSYFRASKLVVELIPLQDEVRNEVRRCSELAQGIRAIGIRKSEIFKGYRISDIFYLWTQLRLLILEGGLLQGRTHEDYERHRNMKTMLKIIHAKIQHLREFVDLNQKILFFMQEVLKNYASPFLEDTEINDSSVLLINSSSLVSGSFIKSAELDLQVCSPHLNYIQEGVRRLFNKIVYEDEQEMGKLSQYVRFEAKTVSSKNYFLLGLYIGLVLVILLSLVVLLVFNYIYVDDSNSQYDSMTYIFPMFRGVGLLILYLWGMAWNVYGFICYRINFRSILEFGSHYSSHFEIMKRAGFFTLVFCIMLLLYLLGLSLNYQLKDVRLPIEYTPFVVWLLYFTYIFFPNRHVFNPRGRTYFYALLKQILLTPIVKMGFVLSYASDQAVSFVIPIKDFAYTVCYYTSYWTDNPDDPTADVRDCLSNKKIDGIVIAYVVALIPLVIRMIQCFRLARQTSGLFIGHLQMWNFLKYMTSAVTVTLSFFSSQVEELLYPFIASSIISTAYSYYWDLKYDWGFLEPKSRHKFLRNTLAYGQSSIYYCAMCLNLLFRCSWTLSIAPSVVRLIPKATFLPFLTGLIEIMRRCMWNFFRIEKEHVANCSTFTIIKRNAEEVLAKIKLHEENLYQVNNYQHSMICFMQLSPTADEDMLTYLRNSTVPIVTKAQVDHKRNQFLDLLTAEEELLLSDSYCKQIKLKITPKDKFC